MLVHEYSLHADIFALLQLKSAFCKNKQKTWSLCAPSKMRVHLNETVLFCPSIYSVLQGSCPRNRSPESFQFLESRNDLLYVPDKQDYNGYNRVSVIERIYSMASQVFVIMWSTCRTCPMNSRDVHACKRWWRWHAWQGIYIFIQWCVLCVVLAEPSYTHDSERTPKSILCLHNRTFLHAHQCTDLFEKPQTITTTLMPAMLHYCLG